MKWEHPKPGLYKATDGPYDVVVVQDGELWRSVVCFEGLEIDRGEWDGRYVALRNASSAVKRAANNRAALHFLNKKLKEDELFDDEDDE